MRWQHLKLAMVCWLVMSAAAVAEPTTFTRILLGAKRDVVGMLKAEGAEFEIFDLRTRQTLHIPNDKALKVDRNLTDDQVIGYIGLLPVIAYRIKERSAHYNQSERTTGKIAQVSPTAIYVTLGKNQGIEVGQKLSVFRSGPEIKDPDTGVVLARERPKVAELDIFEVAESFSKGRLVGGLEIALQKGDEVDAKVARFLVAVLPILGESGTDVAGGDALREQLVTALVQQNVPVVERSQLDKVVTEEIVQNQRLFFEASQAQRFGKLLGASLVVTGRITAVGKTVEAHVRLVDVGTGEIILAAADKLGEDAAVPVPKGKVVVAPKIQDLIQEARSGDRNRRKAAIHDLAETKSPEAAKFLAEEMLTEDLMATEDALVSMGPVAADALARVIDIGDFHQRNKAMRVFSKVATKKHIPFLKKLTYDIHLRKDAERTIRRLQDE